MLARQHIQTIGQERQRRIAKFVSRLFGTLSWITAIVTATVLFILLSVVPWGLNVWTWALALVGTVVVGGLLIVLTEKYERKFLEKAGYGIKTLENSGARVEDNTAVFALPDRKVVADAVISFGPIPSKYVRRIAGAAYTRIRVEHRGKIPCVIQLSLRSRKHISFFDKDIYTQWE